MITLNSLLECVQPKDILILRIIRTIPLTILHKMLIHIYKLHIRVNEFKYQDSIFKRHEEFLDLEMCNSDEYFETIIESGINIYIIIYTVI